MNFAQQTQHQRTQQQTQQPKYETAAQPYVVHPAAKQPGASDGEALSITSFVLGLVAIFTGNLMAAVAGLVLGIVARKRGDHHHNFNLWGIILSSVAIGVSLLVLTFIFLMFAFLMTLIPVGLGLAGA